MKALVSRKILLCLESYILVKKAHNAHLYNRCSYLYNFIKHSTLNLILPFNIQTCKSIKFIFHLKKDGLLQGLLRSLNWLVAE